MVKDLSNNQSASKTVITYGTFDLLHYGHIELLRRAKGLGDYLIVALSSDEFNQIKGKKSSFDYEKRKEILSAINYVDEVIPEHNWEQKRQDIINYQVDIFVMGDDWSGKFDDLSDICKVVYLSRTPDISSTAIKEMQKKDPAIRALE
ncbi:MAG: glycerol-3-phosphate cytidylyltransferase [Candidatus Saccharimonadales bacterium]